VTGGLVTVGVPVYRGRDFLAASLDSLQAQTHRDLRVIVALDVPDTEDEAIARRYVGHDPRFELIIRSERLGWARQIGRLMEAMANDSDFWCYHQQDDVLDPRYFETLVAHARAHTEASLVFCDIEAFGEKSGPLVHASVTGPPATRQLLLMQDASNGVPFRGLARTEAVRVAGAIPHNSHEFFWSDVTWSAGMARAGELHRVPRTLYRKRYHAQHEHGRWLTWPTERRRAAWVEHCVAMLEQAMVAPATTVTDRRLLWLACVGRLLASRIAEPYVEVSAFDAAERRSFAEALVSCARERPGLELADRLRWSWDAIRSAALEFVSGEPGSRV
jgi:hypothetical protein